jgi:hypothetical protein
VTPPAIPEDLRRAAQDIYDASRTGPDGLLSDARRLELVLAAVLPAYAARRHQALIDMFARRAIEHRATARATARTEGAARRCHDEMLLAAACERAADVLRDQNGDLPL